MPWESVLTLTRCDDCVRSARHPDDDGVLSDSAKVSLPPFDSRSPDDLVASGSALTWAIALALLSMLAAACGPRAASTARPALVEEVEAPPRRRLELPVHSITDIAVLSLNVRHEPLDQGVNAWSSRRELMFEVIREREPDLIGIQEASRRQMEELTRALPRYGIIGVGSTSGDGQGAHNAIMFRADRFQIDERGIFWLSDEPEQPGSTSWGNAQPRTCIWARFHERMGGRIFLFFNTHLDHRAAESRARGLALMAERMQAFEGLPIIVSGDFNVGADDTVVTDFLERAGLLDTLRAKVGELAGAMGTFHGFRGTDDGQRVDLVLVSRGVYVVEAEILRNGRDGRYPSDHFPVFGRVQLGTF